MSDPNESFQKLEEKLLRLAELVRQGQNERRGRREELEKLRAAFKERTQQLAALERELQTLRREREEVRARVEKLLKQVDGLTKPTTQS